MKEGDIKEDCEPKILNKDIYEGVSSINWKELAPIDAVHPWGLIEKSFYNHSFEIKRKGKMKV